MRKPGWWEQFVADQRRRNLAPSTITSRRRIVAAFAAWLDPTDLFDATAEDVERWLDSKQVGAKARATDLSHLSVFYAWAQRAGLTDENPVDRIVRPKVPAKVPTPIPEWALETALAHAPDLGLRLMFLLAGTSGLRVSEVAGVHRSDVMDDRSPVRLRVAEAKGGRQRVVPLLDQTLAAVRAVSNGTDRLLWTPTGLPASGKYVSTQMGEHLEMLGLGRWVPHNCRDRAITEYYRATRDLVATQRFAGHSDPAMTVRYVGLVGDDEPEALAALAVG